MEMEGEIADLATSSSQPPVSQVNGNARPEAMIKERELNATRPEIVPDVAEAAVIGVVHPKWDERPLLVVVKKEGREPARDDILKYMDGKIAKWWMPDDVQFVTEIPHTATGKINKLKLACSDGDLRERQRKPYLQRRSGGLSIPNRRRRR